MWFTRVSIQNPVFATMMMMSLFVLGLFSYQRLAVEELPDVKFPVVVIQTSYPGAAPEIVETEVARKLEEAVNTISGIKQVTSKSYESQSLVIAEFELSVDPEIAVQDVREKVAAVAARFRDEIEAPVISRYDPSEMPIISVAIGAEQLDLRTLTSRATQFIKKRFETISGVGRVSLLGGVAREVEIRIKPEQMAAMKIGVDEISAALRKENTELPIGTLQWREREQVVQLRARLAKPEDFGRIVVAWRAGSPVYLDQLATIKDGEAEAETLAIVNGRAGLTMDILKINGANTVEVSERIHATVAELNRTLATEGIKLTVLNDSATGIRNSLADVRATLLEGAALTIAIVFLFLGSWRSTVITGLTLPVALVGTLFALDLAGFTLNVMTMMAFSLCIGLLIDDAIVVRENIVRHTAMGRDHYEAALIGTKEIGLAVLATTSTIVAVFLPVGFMGGIIGRFFHQFGITVCAAVLISMFVSFTLDPMLSSVWRDPHAEGGPRPFGRFLDAFERGLARVGEIYGRLIGWSLRHRAAVLGIGIASLVLALALARFIGAEFVPKADLSRFVIQFSTPVGSALDYTAAKTGQIEAIVREYPEVTDTYTTINSGNAQGKHNATITVLLKPRRERTRSQQELMPILRERVGRIAGVEIRSVMGLGGGGPGGKTVQVSLQGADLNELARLSQAFTAELAQIDGLVDIESSMKAAKPALDIDVKRDIAGSLGFSPAQIGAALRPLIAGDAVTTWLAPDGENYDVNLRLPRSERENAEQIGALQLASPQKDAAGQPLMVSLSQLADVRSSESPVQINRRDLFREVEITANIQDRPLGAIQQEINSLQARFALPPGYRFMSGGDAKSMGESAGYALAALVLGIAFIYMILASQFGSFLQPLAIMMSLPLSLVGVLLALLVWRSTLNIFSVIGVIMLMGLVTKNAILLVDYANHLRREGLARTEALIEAGRVRLRPILMTTAAMVLGMMPLALSVGEGSEQRAPMAHAIIGGVLTSTLLTLIVVPVVFCYLDDFGCWCKRKFGAGKH